MSSSGYEEIAANLPNGRETLPGVITAGQPSEADIARLAESGVRTVIDLRAPNEQRGFDEPAVVASAGMTYRNIPVSPPAVGPGEFDELRKLLADENRQPVLIHCGSGNRVGALLIPYLMMDKLHSSDEALQIARKVGLRSDDLARAALDYVAVRKPGTGPT